MNALRVLRRDHILGWLWNANPWLMLYQRWLLSVSTISVTVAFTTIHYIGIDRYCLPSFLDQLNASGVQPLSLIHI